MQRREFLRFTAAAAMGAMVKPGFAADRAATTATTTAAAPHSVFDPYFLQITQGFLRNAVRTGPGFAVCDFPEGTIVKSCQTPSNHAYVSVARMLPALTEWVVSKKQPSTFEIDGKDYSLDDVLLQIFQNAFDPNHPNY